MTLAGKLAALFPTLHFALILASLYSFVQSPNASSFALFFAAIYLFPLLVYRLVNAFAPVQEGITDLASPTYNPWWTSHQIQLLFIAVPAIEGFLHLIPGLFSLWLRLWGAKIGKKVYWTPKVEIVDRGLIEIGDYAIIGHMSAMCSHLVTPIDGKTSLVVRKVRVGRAAVIGGKVGLGPGSDVKDGELVKYNTTVWWKGARD